MKQLASIFKEDVWYAICEEAKIHKHLDLWLQNEGLVHDCFFVGHDSDRFNGWYQKTPPQKLKDGGVAYPDYGKLIKADKILFFRLRRTTPPVFRKVGM